MYVSVLIWQIEFSYDVSIGTAVMRLCFAVTVKVALRRCSSVVVVPGRKYIETTANRF
jgi:hypothetical protein